MRIKKKTKSQKICVTVFLTTTCTVAFSLFLLFVRITQNKLETFHPKFNETNSNGEPQEIENTENTGNEENKNKIDFSAEIKKSFMRIWNIYKEKGWGHDYVRPISGEIIDEFNASYTMSESLTTLILMDEMNEAEEILKHFSGKTRIVICELDEKSENFEIQKKRATFNKETGKYEIKVGTHYYGNATKTSFFIPSVIGSFLSAYDLTNDNGFLIIASNSFQIIAINDVIFILDDLVKIKNHLIVNTPPTSAKSHAMGAHQLELLTLSKTKPKTKDKLIAQALQMYVNLEERTRIPFLISDEINAFNGEGTNTEEGNRFSLEVNGCSIYENLAKQYILTKESGKTGLDLFTGFVSIYGEEFLRDVNGSMFVSNVYQDKEPKMSIRAAGLPGVIYQIAKKLNDQELETIAKNALDAYIGMIQSDSLPPLLVSDQFKTLDDSFEFAPELFSSLYTFWRESKDEYYRKLAWRMFVKFNETCWSEYGYSNLKNGKRQDETNPLLFSKTFKYLYLMFKEDSPVNSGDWIFTHHGNPIKIWENAYEAVEKQGFSQTNRNDFGDIGNPKI